MFIFCRASEHPYPLAPHELPEVPRPVEFTRVSRVSRGAVLAAFLVVPNLILWFGLTVVRPYRDLQASGRAADAVVTGRYTTRGSKGSTVYWARVRYTVDDKPYARDVPISADAYGRLQEGQSAFDVTYLPSDPNTYCVGKPGPYLEQKSRLAFLWAVGTALVLGVPFLLYHISMCGELYLARNGEAVVGRITSKELVRGRNTCTYWVRYAFESGDRPVGHGTKMLSREIWDYLCMGLPVTVLYLPESPRRCQLLCGFDHVRFLPVPPREEMQSPSPDEAA
jgi:hypothetical protein